MSKGTRYKVNKKSLVIKKKISFILFLFFIVLFIVSGIKIINYFKDARSNEKIFDEISKDIIFKEDTTNSNDTKYLIDFASLKKKNFDTVGFIKVNGTDIEHVVVRGKDNSYYLTHNFEKNYNIAGWIFVDYHNKLDGSDKNIIIYGHNMRNNTMFGTLKNILTDDWKKNEENKNITFVTEKGQATYEVFSVYQIEEEDYYLKTSFSDGEFKKYVDNMKARSEIDFNVNVTEEDSILTLSTCANNNKYRVILHAKKIK